MSSKTSVGSIASFHKGRGLPKADLSPDGVFSCIHYGELFTKYGAVIDSVTSRTNSNTPVRSVAGDVLMPTSDVTPRGLAKASAILESGVLLGGDVLIIRPNATRVDSRYLAHSIRNDPDQVLALVRGSTVYHLYATDMRNFEITLPSVQVQALVADALQDADDLVTALESLIAKKQAIKQGMMQQLLTGRTRLPGFTKPWTEVVLGDLAKFSKGSGLPKAALSTDGVAPCIHYGELFTWYGTEISQVSSRTTPAGPVVTSERLDVLMPMSDVTPTGLAKASAIHDPGVVLGGDILIIRPAEQFGYGPFLAHAIRRDAAQVLKLVRGSTIYHLYASDMRSFELAIPSVAEQKVVSEVLLDAEREIEGLKAKLQKTRAIKVGMMQQLLTGRTRLAVEDAA